MAEDAFWWHGSLYRMKARAADTGGTIGVVDATFWHGFGPPMHVHNREDESFYVIEGDVRFRVRDDEFTMGPGSWLFAPRGLPHTFTVDSETARALILFTPGGFERMFEIGGVPVGDSPEPPAQEYDVDHTTRVSREFDYDIVGPRLTSSPA